MLLNRLPGRIVHIAHQQNFDRAGVVLIEHAQDGAEHHRDRRDADDSGADRERQRDRAGHRERSDELGRRRKRAQADQER